MSEGRERVEKLLVKLDEVNQEVEKACRACTEAQLQRALPGDGRPTGVVFHHIAVSYSAVAEWAVQIANREMIPELTKELIDEFNAEHAAGTAGISKAGVLGALQKHAARAADLLQPMTDDQMDSLSSVPVMGYPSVKAGSFFNAAAIEHAKGHLHTIRTGLGLQT